jgi:MFS transporter, DHA3 family, macrolide efflux protein
MYDDELADSIVPPPGEEEEHSANEALTVAASLNAETLRSLFRNRNFVPLWIGQLVSYIGDQFMLIAVLAVIQQVQAENDRSSLPIVFFGISLAAPQLLFGLIGGVLVDKQDRKWTMIISDIARALALFAMLVVNRQPDRLWVLYLAVFVIGTAQMLFYPARASALPAVVRKKDLAAANALLEAGFVVALIFGSGAAGLLVAQFGENFAFVFNGIAFLFSAVMIWIMRIPKHAITASSMTAAQVWRELRQGLSYVWHTRSMRYIMGLSIMVAVGIGAVTILILDYLSNELNIGPDGFGAVIGILGVGIVIGGVLIQRLSKFLPTNRLVALAILMQAIAVGVFILHPPFGLVLVFTALIGFSLIVSRAVLSTLTQAIPPEEYRARVQSTFNLISAAPTAASVAMIAFLVSVTSREIVVMGLAVMLLITAWLAANMLRGIDDAIYSETT